MPKPRRQRVQERVTHSSVKFHTIILPALGIASLTRQVIAIDPTDLENALRQDALTAAIRLNGR
jgi:hypothetical protein